MSKILNFPHSLLQPQELDIQQIRLQVIQNAGEFAAPLKHYIDGLSTALPNAQQTIDRRYQRAFRIQENVQKLVATAVEDLDSDDEKNWSDEIRCLHWNCGGIRAQFDRRKGLGLAAVLAFLRPDVVCLNELKCRANDGERQVIQALAASCGYDCVFTPSSAPHGRAMRGSAIFYKARKVQFRQFSTYGDASEVQGVPAFEMVSALFSFQGADIWFNSFYFAPQVANVSNLRTHIEHFRSNQFSIFAGDLNIPKSSTTAMFNAVGLKDTLNPNWPTNWSMRSVSAIDYVLANESHFHRIRAHRPIRPEGTNIHGVLVFDVRPAGFSARSPCTHPRCTICNYFSFR